MDGEQFITLDDINIRSVIIDLLRNIWIVILAAVTVWLLFSCGVSLLYQPEYTSTAVFAVNEKGSSNSYSSLSVTRSMAGVYAEVFESDLLREKVASALEEKELEDRILAEVISETNLLKISVVSKTPERSYQVLNLILDSYPSVSDYLFDNAIMELVDRPGIMRKPSNPIEIGKYRIFAVAAVTFLTAMLIAVLSALRDTVQTRQGAKHKLDGALFGIIYHEDKKRSHAEKGKKTAALITNQLVGYRFMEDNKTLSAKVDYHMKRHNQKVILVSSANENEGKSTIAANLALSLSERGNQVLLMDCDFRQPAVHKVFEIKKQVMDLGAYLLSNRQDCENKVLVKEHGIYLAVNRNNYGTVQKLIASDKMKSFLEKQRTEMDYIIIDSPPMLVAADTEALSQICDTSLLVVRQDWSMVQDINDCIDILKKSSSEYLGYILNDVRYEMIDRKKFGR